jgi:uncharacterized protein YndB with AHSA1/START domain
MKNAGRKQMKDDTSLMITRVFDAPGAKVWEARTTPQGGVSWYGKPYEVPHTSVEMDRREGNEIKFTGEYKEVTKPQKKLVLTIENTVKCEIDR